MGETIDKVKGKVKQAAGVITDDDDLVREGKRDVLKGKAKGAVKDAKEAGHKAMKAVKDAVK